MPSYVIRVDRHEPALYCMWSTVVDDVTGIGSRDELKANRWFKFEEVADARFDRADATGTSDLYENESLRTGSWDASGFVCQQKWLPRSRLRGYVEDRARGGDGSAFLDVIVDDDAET